MSEGIKQNHYAGWVHGLLSRPKEVMVWNFYFSAMKGEPAREEKWKFLIRGGLLLALLMRAPSAEFAYFLPTKYSLWCLNLNWIIKKQKVRKSAFNVLGLGVIGYHFGISIKLIFAKHAKPIIHLPIFLYSIEQSSSEYSDRGSPNRSICASIKKENRGFGGESNKHHWQNPFGRFIAKSRRYYPMYFCTRAWVQRQCQCGHTC